MSFCRCALPPLRFDGGALRLAVCLILKISLNCANVQGDPVVLSGTLIGLNLTSPFPQLRRASGNQNDVINGSFVKHHNIRKSAHTSVRHRDEAGRPEDVARARLMQFCGRR